MSRRRGPMRGAKITKRHTSFMDSDSSESSEEEIDLLHVFEAILQQSRRKRARGSTSKRTPKKPGRRLNVKTVKQQSSPIQPCENVDLAPLESDEEKPHISETVIADHTKQVEDKVNKFFQSNNLVSDDDDEEIIPKPSNVVKPPEPKDFYELSDSDEELKKIIDSTNSASKTEITSSLVASGSKDIEENKNDELMDIVDKILDDDNCVNLTNNEVDESWSSYKNKAQDMLGNINSLLSEIDEQTQPTEQPKPSPEKAKPTCPICLEGGDISRMATICGHIFCKDCITNVAQTTKKCPTCRKQVNLKKIHPVYL